MRPETVPISVVICTRDRPDQVRRCLENVRWLNPRPLEVIVVDQGSAPIEIPPGIRSLKHLRTGERGLSRARNLGLAAAQGRVVAFLDDDCTVGPGWAGSVAAAFERHRDAGIVFGKVVGPSRVEGMYVPVYSIVGERRLTGRLASPRAHGIGAAMYLRAGLVDVVGSFDPELGAGSGLHSSEDWDYTFRALTRGVTVVETATITVQHHGARRYADGSASDLLRKNAFSHGAVHAKLVRCFDPMAIVLIASELVSMLKLLRPWNVLLKKPTNIARPAMYAAGFAAGMRMPVDRGRKVFVRHGPKEQAMLAEVGSA